MNRKARVGFLLVLSALCIAGLAALGPGTAAAQDCGDNPDGSTTCTSSIPQILDCPEAYHSTLSISPGIVIDVPATANVTGYLLTQSPPCAGSTLTDLFEPNASTPAAPPGYKTVRDDPTWTCDQIGGCPAAKVGVKLDVTYTDLFGGNPPPGFGPPNPADTQVDKKASVHGTGGVEADVRTDKESWDLFISNISGVYYFPAAVPRAADASAKHARVATFEDSTIPAGQTSTTLHGHLTARGRRLLHGLGKLKVTLQGTISNSAGSAALSRKLTLIGKK